MKIIERWKKSLYRKAVKHRLIAPQVIVLMDGGVCSQMHQYLLGRIFENGGHKVICLSMKSGEQIWITSLYVTSIC